MTSEATNDGQNDLKAENRHLKETIVALRTTLDQKEIEKDERIQEALAAANDEIGQLKAAIQAVREEMERQKLNHAEELQAARKASRDEMAELKKTIQLLREKLEECDGG